MVTKICVTSVISTTMPNVIEIGLGVSVLRMRDFAPLGYFFGFLMRKATAETRAPIFDEKYVKRRGSAQGSAFWGSRNQYLRFGFHFPPKPPFLGTISTGLRFFFARKRL